MAYAVSRKKEMDRIVAAINLDFVGQDQDLCKSALTYQVNPESLPNFIDHYMNELFDFFREQFFGPSNTKGIPFFKTKPEPFWHNDNIISDPSIGVPSVAFINWPDKFYHTSFDTEDKIHPPSIKRVGELAATWVCGIACAGREEVEWFAECVSRAGDGVYRRGVEKVLAELDRKLPALKKEERSKALGDAFTAVRRYLDYLAWREKTALHSVKRLLPDKEAADFDALLVELEAEIMACRTQWQRRAARRLEWLARKMRVKVPEVEIEPELTPAEKRAARMVPVRLFRGMLIETRIPERIRKALGKVRAKGFPKWAHYWVDGKRTLLDICRLTEQERLGVADAERMIKWCELMAKAGLFRIKRIRKGVPPGI